MTEMRILLNRVGDQLAMKNNMDYPKEIIIDKHGEHMVLIN
jgi:hypothetical protein